MKENSQSVEEEEDVLFSSFSHLPPPDTPDPKVRLVTYQLTFYDTFGARSTLGRVVLVWASTSMQPFLWTQYPAQRLESKLHVAAQQGKIEPEKYI